MVVLNLLSHPSHAAIIPGSALLGHNGRSRQIGPVPLWPPDDVAYNLNITTGQAPVNQPGKKGEGEEPPILGIHVQPLEG